jgi:Ala-tRNA(Pro) deacylase
MPATQLKKYLDEEQVRYIVLIHSPAYTTQQIAALAHVSGKKIAKTVMVNIDEKMCMAVVPASQKVDLERLQDLSGAASIDLACEEEFRSLFPDCEIGAMPPFGHLYNMPVYVADCLAEDEEICFNAGNHRELIRLAYADFARLEKPICGEFSLR